MATEARRLYTSGSVNEGNVKEYCKGRNWSTTVIDEERSNH